MRKAYESWSIGSLSVKNRFVRAATAESLCTKQGAPSKRLADLYGGLVRGGVGMVITGYSYVCPDGKPSDRSISLCDDSVEDELRMLVDAVHRPQDEEAPELVRIPSLEQLRAGIRAEKPKPRDARPAESGVRIIAQLVYGGSKSKLAPDDERWLSADAAEGEAEEPNARVLGPSAIKHPVTGIVPQPASRADIERVVSSFASAAVRAKRVGFDGVEIHAAHGYLISQFLDGRFNKRTDEYGVSLEGRARLARECVAAVRAALGDDYPVLVKLNSYDVLDDPSGVQGGMSEAESLQVAQWLVESGASCVEVSGDWHAVDREDMTGEPFFGAYATRLARKIDAPVILTGGWRDPEAIDRYLDQTGIAGIGMARPLICQPYLPELWSTGSDRVAECDSCNFCAKHNGIPCILRKGR